MSPVKAARVLSTAVWPPELPDLRQWVARVLVGALCLAAALTVTGVRLQITRLGYDLDHLTQERDGVAAAVDRLEVQVATLASAKRIEKEALGLGLVHPGKGSIVVLDE